ncbi:sigma factor-like helix-turn-helix DNA-binding protein [Geothrix campi]|uniref:sigma factor-like helix-turn-helix DNA-binding protein n=1 Tax=Geothrix campi TaxID=2966450 RepID=UPI003CC67210
MRIEGLTYREIGESLGVSTERAAQLVRHGVRYVAPQIKSMWYYPSDDTKRFLWEMQAAHALGQRISFMPVRR